MHEVYMGISFNLDAQTLAALEHFLRDNHKIKNQTEAVQYFLKKSLQDLGYLGSEPSICTTPDHLNSSNDD